MQLPIPRRRFVRLGLATAAFHLCAGAKAQQLRSGARLHARPTKPKQQAAVGRHSFGLGQGKDGYLSVPSSYAPGKALPVIIMLHGSHGIEGFQDYCEGAAKEGIAVALPESRGRTWDRIRGSFGPDIAFLDRVLAYTFDRLTIDPQHFAIAGFSDGGSYALSVGLSNGDLFSHVIAYSPEFLSAPVRFGKPPIFIAHGVQDQVLPINPTEQMVRKLKESGYTVDFREFTGGHMMRPDLVRESWRWFLGARA
ncbi:MAG TPA: dienelactone hydrolase family protein [Chthoniobacterales bacterium]|nr:dienelactone hydrolase family protein [Chthoniobacterales bacterium]